MYYGCGPYRSGHQELREKISMPVQSPKKPAPKKPIRTSENLLITSLNTFLQHVL